MDIKGRTIDPKGLMPVIEGGESFVPGKELGKNKPVLDL